MLITNLVGYFRLPVLRRGYTLLVNLRFTRTMAILLQGGQSLVEGLTLAGRATGSSWVAFLAEQQTESIRHGSSLADAIRRIPPLAESLPGWIQAGEAGGNLDKVLETAVKRYRFQWDRFVQRFMILFQSSLVLVLGLVVLFVFLSFLLPIMSVNDSI